MSKISEDNFIKLTRLLSLDQDWIDARPTHQSIFICILLRMAYSETEQHFIRHTVKINPCQLYVSQNQLAKWSSKWITKDDVEGALKYFTKVKFLLHKVLHKKTLITVIHSDICEQFLKRSPPKTTPPFLHHSSTKEEREERKERDHHPYPSSKIEPMIDDDDFFSNSKEKEENTREVGNSDCHLLTKKVQHNIENQTQVPENQIYNKGNNSKNANKIEIIPGKFLTQQQLDDCIKFWGSRTTVEDVVREIFNNWDGRQYEIRNLAKTVLTWNRSKKTKLKTQIADNESYGKDLCIYFPDYEKGNGWRCYVYRDKLKDQQGVLFENQSPYVESFFVSYCDADFKNKCFNFLKDKEMIKQKVEC